MLGRLLIGVIFCLFDAEAVIYQDYVIFFGSGLLGAFTTMSAFAMDTVNLSENEIYITFIYVTISIVGSLGLAWSGYKIGFILFS